MNAGPLQPAALDPALQHGLLGLLVISAAVWLGGWVCLVVVARSTSATLSREARVAFFRHFGRRYGVVATVALVVALVTGGILLANTPWSALSGAIVIVATVLVVVLAIGIVQARRMTRLRRRAIAADGDARLNSLVARGARSALALRAGIGVISLALVVLAVLL